MPIISFVTGYIYLSFGSYKTFQSLGFSQSDSFFISTVLSVFTSSWTLLIAKSNAQNIICPKSFALQMLVYHFSLAVATIPILIFSGFTPSFASKTFTVFCFFIFGVFLNLGPAHFPTFSVSDPFYWNQDRWISPLYDRALKSVALAGICYLMAHLSPFWHTILTVFLILCDVVRIGWSWEIARLGEEEPVVQDVHLD